GIEPATPTMSTCSSFTSGIFLSTESTSYARIRYPSLSAIRDDTRSMRAYSGNNWQRRRWLGEFTGQQNRHPNLFNLVGCQNLYHSFGQRLELTPKIPRPAGFFPALKVG